MILSKRLKKNAKSILFGLSFLACANHSQSVNCARAENKLVCDNEKWEDNYVLDLVRYYEYMKNPHQVVADNDDNYRIYKTILNEAILMTQVRAYYHLSEGDYQTFMTALISEAQKSGLEYNEIDICAKLLQLSRISNEEKIAAILQNLNITSEEFERVASVCLAESGCDATRYIETYAVASVLLNRLADSSWRQLGNTVYTQAYAKGQFVVCTNGRANRFYGRKDLLGYQAVIDCLYIGGQLPMHGYTSFRSYSSPQSNRVNYIVSGNRFFNELSLEERNHRYSLEEEIQLVPMEEPYEVYYEEIAMNSLKKKRTL